MERLDIVLSALRRLPTSTHPVIVALDGPCAAGKSTLGARLADTLACPLFHMDDFFLPLERKTPERLAQPGGNVDWERFLHEVLQPLSRGETVTYRPYSCHANTLMPPVSISPAPLAVVEGVYALEPALRPYYALTCYVDAPWPVRETRLLQRCGPEGLEVFLQRWIPLEERYFQTLEIAAGCDLIL